MSDGKCDNCGAPFHSGLECMVPCESCGVEKHVPPHNHHEPRVDTPSAVSAPAAPPAAKKKWSVLERIAIGYGVYVLLNLICAPLGALPFLFVNWEDTTSLAVALVVGIVVFAVLPIVGAVMVVVRMTRKQR